MKLILTVFSYSKEMTIKSIMEIADSMKLDVSIKNENNIGGKVVITIEVPVDDDTTGTFFIAVGKQLHMLAIVDYTDQFKNPSITPMSEIKPERSEHH